MARSKNAVLVLLVLLGATRQCDAQATFFVYNDTPHGVTFHWSSDIFPFDSRTLLTGTTAPVVITNVPVRATGFTNFIAIGEILLPTGRMPGAKFRAENGEQIFIWVHYADPGYWIEVRHARDMKGLLGDEIYNQWTRSLMAKAQESGNVFDASGGPKKQDATRRD